MTMLAKRKM